MPRAATLRSAPSASGTSARAASVGATPALASTCGGRVDRRDDVVRRERRGGVIRGHLRAVEREHDAADRARPACAAVARPCVVALDAEHRALERAHRGLAVGDRGQRVQRADAADLVARPAPSSSSADAAPAQCSSTWRLLTRPVPTSICATSPITLIAHREDHDLGLEQDVGRRRRERRDARGRAGRARGRRRAAPTARARARRRGAARRRARSRPDRRRRRTWWDCARSCVELVRGDIPQDRARQQRRRPRRVAARRAARARASTRSSGIVDAGRRARGQWPPRPITIGGARATSSSQRYHLSVSRRMSAPITRRSACAGARASVLDEIERAARDEAGPLRELLLGAADLARARRAARPRARTSRRGRSNGASGLPNGCANVGTNHSSSTGWVSSTYSATSWCATCGGLKLPPNRSRRAS